MLNLYEVMETNKMIDHDLLDVRTITMGISLLDCAGTDLQEVNEKIYAKILKYAGKLVETGESISRDFGIPIVNKRVSVTPIALVGGIEGDTDPFRRDIGYMEGLSHQSVG